MNNDNAVTPQTAQQVQPHQPDHHHTTTTDATDATDAGQAPAAADASNLDQDHHQPEDNRKGPITPAEARRQIRNILRRLPKRWVEVQQAGCVAGERKLCAFSVETRQNAHSRALQAARRVFAFAGGLRKAGLILGVPAPTVGNWRLGRHMEAPAESLVLLVDDLLELDRRKPGRRIPRQAGGVSKPGSADESRPL